MKLIDTKVSFENDTNGDLVIRRDQEIPQSHLDALREAKDATIGRPMGDLHRFASIPTALADAWMRQGFNIYQASAKDIIKKLQADHLDAFITTHKTI